MPCIIVEKGPERGTSVEIGVGGRVIFGRDESCDFVTQDVSCSRRHFGVGEKDGKYIVKDLGSTHGTLVNGRRVDRAELRDGDTIVVGESTISFSMDSPGASRGLVGKSIAGYQIIERIGRGGMGTVYRAKQIALDREVALKVLSHRYSDDKIFINRFFKEAQAAARLNNPNVVQVYDVREEKGLYLISLEMMDGGTIQDLATRDGQLPISRVLSVARDAARGLVYAEKKSIVHGDIKPDNLMANSEGVVKISDLGLARDAGEVAHQGEEGIFGTPHFISPEQAQGKPVDSRSDIYSLGATLYRLIAGTTPFTGADVREIVLKQINDAPEDLVSLREDCPRDLADLVSLMMAKDPADRFATAEELLSAVESLGTSGTLQKGSGSKGALAAGLLVLVLGGAAAWYFLAGPGKKVDPVAPIDDGTEVVDSGNGGQIDAEAERRLAAIRAGELLTEADRFDLGMQRNGRADDVEALSELKAKYKAAFDAAPDSEAGLEAANKALKVDERIKAVRARTEDMARRREEAEAKLSAAATAVDGAIEKGRFAEALGHALAAVGDIGDEFSDVAGRTAELRDRVDSAATGARDDAMNRSAAALKDNDFDAARAALAPLLEGYADGAEGDEYEAILAVAAVAKSRIGDIDRRESQFRDAAATAARKADDDLIAATLREHYQATTKGFDPSTLLPKLESLAAELKTEHYAALVERTLRRTRRLVALNQALATKIASGETVNVSSGSREIPRGQVTAVDEGQLAVTRKGSTKTVKWTDVPPDSLFTVLWRKFATTPREHLDVAIYCLETGQLEEATEIVEELEEEEVLADEVAHFRSELDSEKAAAARLKRIDRLYRAAKAGRDDAWFRLKRELDGYFRDFRSTRSFILSSTGKTPLLP